MENHSRAVSILHTLALALNRRDEFVKPGLANEVEQMGGYTKGNQIGSKKKPARKFQAGYQNEKKKATLFRRHRLTPFMKRSISKSPAEPRAASLYARIASRYLPVSS
jgi:hypothetical protein